MVKLFEIVRETHALAMYSNVGNLEEIFKASSSDHGTFGHLCTLLGRIPAAKVPKKDMNTCTDALFTVLKGHFVAYTCKLLGISDPNDTPKTLPPLNSKEDKQKLIA